jgi:hypothetical protein
MSSTNPPTDGASYTASLHANVLADDVNDRMVDYYHNNGINWPNPTYTQGQVGDPYEPVAYYGTYSLEDINGFYDRLDYGELYEYRTMTPSTDLCSSQFCRNYVRAVRDSDEACWSRLGPQQLLPSSR